MESQADTHSHKDPVDSIRLRLQLPLCIPDGSFRTTHTRFQISRLQIQYNIMNMKPTQAYSSSDQCVSGDQFEII